MLRKRRMTHEKGVDDGRSLYVDQGKILGI